MAPYGQLFTLNTGAKIPAVGLGTWQSKPNEVAEAVKVALQAGYRHIDAAWIYGNEVEVAQGIKESGVPREEIFITTKLWCTHHKDAQKALETSCKNLGVDYVDLYLMHWPVPMNPNGNDPKFPKKPDGTRDLLEDWTYIDTWKEMEKLLKPADGSKPKTKAIGVSNFSVKYLEKLLPQASVVPAANQVELHPYLPQSELVQYCKSKGILMTAYSPLGSSDAPLLKDKTVIEIAQKHNTSAGNVLIAYQVHRGVSVIPKSVTPDRIRSNFNDVPLDGGDMEKLEGIHKQHLQRFIKPAWGVDLGFDDNGVKF